MASVLELREISFAVGDFDAALTKFQAMGFDSTPVWLEQMEPIQARLTSMPVGNSSISIMESSGADTPISRFIEKRGEGIFSFTFVVDDIEGVTEQWRAAGVDFLLDEPVEVRDGFSVGVPIPLIRGNWTRPSTLHGIVIELQEFRDADGNPYRPPAPASAKERA
jgi:methylmalonyl-CoA/ethylmalonyl-CoA epimerase